MINEIRNIVEEACTKESNVFGYGIWTHHITQVVKNGKLLAEIFNADSEIVEIAALLHDYASIKDKTLYKEHHIHGQIEVEKIEKVKHCIATHRGSVLMETKSKEAECIVNADAMTHIEQVPSLLYYAYVLKRMGIDDGAKWVCQKLKRSWNKLNFQVQELMREKYESALKILEYPNK